MTDIGRGRRLRGCDTHTHIVNPLILGSNPNSLGGKADAPIVTVGEQIQSITTFSLNERYNES